MKKINIIREVTKDIKNMGMTDEEFEVTEVKTNDRKGNEELAIQVTFGVKGNKKIIDTLTDKGWKIDRRYKNDDGSPSLYSSDIHGKNISHKFLMIVLKYIIEE